MYDGVYTALITPFADDGSVDEEAFKDLAESQINDGVSGLVPMGTTGESPTLSHEEHLRVIQLTVEQAKGRVPVIAGTGSNSTKEAVSLTIRAKELGADASLQVAPYYNKPTQEGFYRHFVSIAESAKLPLIIYNIPGRSGKNIENETMLRLAEHEYIVGVKEASGNLSQVMDLVMRKPDDFSVLSGDDNLGYPIIALGGHGIISVASNLVAGRMAKLVASALAGDMAKARDLHYELLPLFKALFVETNPIPVKYGMSRIGRTKEVYRLPMCSPAEASKKVVDGVLRDLGLL
jgi:4-hydroxy-tetrahydrodipicolinate synthase